MAKFDYELTGCGFGSCCNYRTDAFNNQNCNTRCLYKVLGIKSETIVYCKDYFENNSFVRYLFCKAKIIKNI